MRSSVKTKMFLSEANKRGYGNKYPYAKSWLFIFKYNEERKEYIHFENYRGSSVFFMHSVFFPNKIFVELLSEEDFIKYKILRSTGCE